MADPVIELVTQAYSAAGSRDRAHGKWTMDRPWYDRLRAAACTEEQERARAREHATILISADAPPPYHCPVCGEGPFAVMKALADHVMAMADPANREPSSRDQLFGIPIEVREDGGEPHLASPFPASPFVR